MTKQGLSQWQKTLRIDGLVQERRSSIVNALELRLFCTNLSICNVFSHILAETLQGDV